MSEPSKLPQGTTFPFPETCPKLVENLGVIEVLKNSAAAILEQSQKLEEELRLSIVKAYPHLKGHAFEVDVFRSHIVVTNED